MRRVRQETGSGKIGTGGDPDRAAVEQRRTALNAKPTLAERGVIVVPDVICNAGGVTVSYFEWVQDMASFFWSEEEINAKMDRIMTDAIIHVCDKAAEKECTLRTAAYIVACERILMARKDRGIYPG